MGYRQRHFGQRLHFIRRLTAGCKDYTGVLDFTAHAPDNQENASGVSADPQVQELVDQICDLTRRDLLTSAAPLPEAAAPAEPLPGAVKEPLSGEPHGRGKDLKTFRSSTRACSRASRLSFFLDCTDSHPERGFSILRHWKGRGRGFGRTRPPSLRTCPLFGRGGELRDVWHSGEERRRLFGITRKKETRM